MESLLGGVSFSGKERNYLYFGGIPGSQFVDVSGVSGADDPGDSRGYALLDYDHDGWLDLAVVNLDAPRLRLFRNTLGDGPAARNRFVALRFVGGNTERKASTEWSARDGFGTSVELELEDGLTIHKEHRTEDGFKTQNTATMLVGIGERDVVRSLKLRWLSGIEQTMTDVPAGMLVTLYEDPAASPSGEAFVMEPYRAASSVITRTRTLSEEGWKRGLLPETVSRTELVVRDDGRALGTESALNLYTTVATWCVACVEELPEFHQLRAAFGDHELAMFGVPIDKEEGSELLESWTAERKPPYEVLSGLAAAEVDKVNRVVVSELRLDAPPAALVTDSAGRVLLSRWGVPSVSELRKLLWLSRVEGQEALGTDEDQ